VNDDVKFRARSIGAHMGFGVVLYCSAWLWALLIRSWRGSEAVLPAEFRHVTAADHGSFRQTAMASDASVSWQSVV
jgi:hypothetical protein